MKYKQLSVEEREVIQAMLWAKESVRAIAKRLGLLRWRPRFNFLEHVLDFQETALFSF